MLYRIAWGLGHFIQTAVLTAGVVIGFTWPLTH